MQEELDERLKRLWVPKGAMKAGVIEDGVGFVRLVDWMGNDDAVVQAARVSHGDGLKTSKEDKKLITFLLTNRHTSPFEHVIFKFHVKAPIFVFRQWHRHRTWSYNEISARYTEMPDEFYVPPVSRMVKQDKKNRQGSAETPINKADTAQQLMRASYREDYNNYEALLTAGLARETAREVLPVSLYSQMYATVDLHNLMGFLSLRLDAHAQWEIRQYAQAMYDLVQPIVPWSIAAFDKNREWMAAFEEWRIKNAD